MTSLITSISAQRNQEMRDYAASRRRALGARRRRTRSAGSAATADRAFIRRLDPSGADRAALEVLAGRDSAAAPSGEVLAAELDGRLIAAVSISTGELVADPFIPTASVVERLELRAKQLRRHGSRRAIRRHGFHISAHPRRS